MAKADYSLTFEDYNDICSDCEDHDKCHKNGINWEKLDKCKGEIRRLMK